MTSQSQTASHSVGVALHDPDLLPHSGFPGYSLIPLTEFGQSLDNPDLDSWFVDFADRNKFCYDFYEITANGELKILPPAGLPHAWHQPQVVTDIGRWADVNGGKVGGVKGRIRMPDGSRQGHDAIWISDERYIAAMGMEHRPVLLSAAPEFVVNLVSFSNRGPELVRKVELFIANGTKLAWIINPDRRLATLYRPGRDPETLVDPETLDGEDVLPGFVFEVRTRIFDNVG